MQDCGNSIVNALELLQFWTEPSTWWINTRRAHSMVTSAHGNVLCIAGHCDVMAYLLVVILTKLLHNWSNLWLFSTPWHSCDDTVISWDWRSVPLLELFPFDADNEFTHQPWNQSDRQFVGKSATLFHAPVSNHFERKKLSSKHLSNHTSLSLSWITFNSSATAFRISMTIYWSQWKFNESWWHLCCLLTKMY